MIRINLLPQERAGRRRIAVPKGMVLLIPAAIVVLVAGSTVLLSQRNARVSNDLARVNREIEVLKPTVQRVEDLRREIDTARRKEQLLRQLEAMRVPWDTVLEEVRTVMPKDVWLTGAEVDDVGKLSFTGFGLTYEAVARFMVSLEGSEMFTDADMAQSQKQRIANRDVINFQVSVKLVQDRKEARTR